MSSRRESLRLKAKSSLNSERSKITMVVNTSERHVKRTKLIKEQTEGEGEDRISFLPDTILHYILSLLPTKCAVSTGVLSTKWKHLWTSISNLDFSDKLSYSNTTHVINPTKEVKFVNFVEKVLRLHDATCILKFYLSSSILLEESHVSAWLALVLNRDVKVVKLKINVDKTLVLPSTLFARESLTIICFESILELPSLNCLTRLRVLHLQGIEISSDEAVEEVSFSCPVLEKFKLMNCPLTNIKTISIFAPALKKLIIQDECGYYYHCELKIYADNLMSLNLKSAMFPKISLCNSTSSSLSEASIITCDQHEVEGEFRLRASKFLEGMCNVKDLILSGQFIKGLDLCVFDKRIWSNGRTPQHFLSSLKSVELRRFCGTKNERRFAECLLKHATALEKMNVMFSSSLSKHTKKQRSISYRLLRLPRTSVCCSIGFSYSHMTSTT